MGTVTSLSGFGDCKLEAYGLNIIVLKVKLILTPASNLFNSSSLLYMISMSVVICTLILRSFVTKASHFDFRRQGLSSAFSSAYHEVHTITKCFWVKVTS